MELIIGVVIGMIVGVSLILVYMKGMRDGMDVSNGEKPEPIHAPVLFKDDGKEPDPMDLREQFNRVMSYQPQYTGDKVE